MEIVVLFHIQDFDASTYFFYVCNIDDIQGIHISLVTLDRRKLNIKLLDECFSQFFFKYKLNKNLITSEPMYLFAIIYHSLIILTSGERTISQINENSSLL